MTEEIPQWAKQRACELANAVSGFSQWKRHEVGKVGYPTLTAFARYIAQHEQPPVDPDLVKAREICARVAEELAKHEFFEGMVWAADYRKGFYDDDPEVQFALSALKEARND